MWNERNDYDLPTEELESSARKWLPSRSLAVKMRPAYACSFIPSRDICVAGPQHTRQLIQGREKCIPISCMHRVFCSISALETSSTSLKTPKTAKMSEMRICAGAAFKLQRAVIFTAYMLMNASHYFTFVDSISLRGNLRMLAYRFLKWSPVSQKADSSRLRDRMGFFPVWETTTCTFARLFGSTVEFLKCVALLKHKNDDPNDVKLKVRVQTVNDYCMQFRVCRRQCYNLRCSTAHPSLLEQCRNQQRNVLDTS